VNLWCLDQRSAVMLHIRISNSPRRLEHSDEATARVTNDDEFKLDVLNQTPGAKQAVAHQKKVFEPTRGNA
jgi:hypothetical protein